MTPSNGGKRKNTKPVLAWGIKSGQLLASVAFSDKYQADSEMEPYGDTIIRVEIREVKPRKKK